MFDRSDGGRWSSMVRWDHGMRPESRHPPGTAWLFTVSQRTSGRGGEKESAHREDGSSGVTGNCALCGRRAISGKCHRQVLASSLTHGTAVAQNSTAAQLLQKELPTNRLVLYTHEHGCSRAKRTLSRA